MSDLHPSQVELIAGKVADLIDRNWPYIELMVRANLGFRLSKTDTVKVAKRALELVEND